MNLKISIWQRLKLGYAFMFGDMADVAGLSLGWFNDSVLQKIRNKEEASLYCKDVKDFAFFLRSVLTRHSGWMAEAKRKAFLAVIDANDCLAAALEDLNVTREELTTLVEHVRKAIKAWKEA